jgi:hypothetical protein
MLSLRGAPIDAKDVDQMVSPELQGADVKVGTGIGTGE